jgi:hypothetical protein
MSILDKVRKFIDGDSVEMVLDKAARDAKDKPRSISEEFIVKLARAVEEVMQREMVPLPQGTTLIPTEYFIFLSEEDDKEWQGVKRKGLEQGLYHVLSERAREISGKKKLETQSFAVELRIDGTLEKGETRVQHGWDEASTNQKTGVIARGQPKLPSEQSPFATQVVQQKPVVRSEELEEATRVQSRRQELYKLEIWRNGVRQSLIPISQYLISIGRGSKSQQVDILLLNDDEISRKHATIQCDGKGKFVISSEGKNPLVVSNIEIPVGERVGFRPGDHIVICSYLLRIQ